MATIKQQLLQPESGWRRYDDRESKITYVGTWTQGSTAGYYNNTNMDSNSLSSYYEFSFFGTKLRIIDALASNRSANVQVTIDGVTESYSAYDATTVRGVLVYEKIGLEERVHKVTVKSNATGYMTLDAIDIDETGYLIASVGQKLSEPEAGWKRYDDTYEHISYKDFSMSNITSAYNGTTMFNPTGSTLGEINFYFKGTSIRILSPNHPTYRTSSAEIYIDGVKETFRTNYINDYTVLSYEKLGLENKFHKVTIKNFVVSSSSYAPFGLDAIDINMDGEIRPPNKKMILKNNINHYSIDSKTLICLSSSSDKNINKYGIGANKEIKLDIEFNKMKFVQDKNEILGKGKEFTHLIDLKSIKNIILKD